MYQLSAYPKVNSLLQVRLNISVICLAKERVAARVYISSVAVNLLQQ